MKKILMIGFALYAGQAMAQQPPPSPNEQALGAKVMQEIQAGLTCSASLIEARAELGKANARFADEIAKAQARIKELEPATQPPDPPAK